MDAGRTHDVVVEAAKATPSLAAIIAAIGGLTVEKWLAIAGIVFILVQAVIMIWRHIIFLRRERDRLTRLLEQLQANESDSDRAAL